MQLMRADREGEVLGSIKEGDVVEGTVKRIEAFGAFVEVAPFSRWLGSYFEISWPGSNTRPRCWKWNAGQSESAQGSGSRRIGCRFLLSLKQGGGEQDPGCASPNSILWAPTLKALLSVRNTSVFL
ncbi:MAG: S1 RNA-binding domain-containing protein [Bdellovibrionaceae bacterium]|nr:S1 RNA-binding domain-containing protein [Pseudobdellovibrionaceae bacterium]